MNMFVKIWIECALAIQMDIDTDILESQSFNERLTMFSDLSKTLIL